MTKADDDNVFVSPEKRDENSPKLGIRKRISKSTEGIHLINDTGYTSGIGPEVTNQSPNTTKQKHWTVSRGIKNVKKRFFRRLITISYN